MGLVIKALLSFFSKAWIKAILVMIFDILKGALLQVGEDIIQRIKDKIIEVSKKEISNEEKLKEVVAYAKSLAPTLKDSVINLLVEMLVSQAKKEQKV